MTADAFPFVVLDTNAVFDLWVFDEPASGGLRRAISTRSVLWIATPAMAQECFAVLARGTLAVWRPDTATLRATWARFCDLVDAPRDADCRNAPRCSDPDDQVFIDLAVARRAVWLFTKDRAVLRLAARLRPFGVETRSPDGWVMPTR